jgi:Raf kinase inhibitor-like YbhB/YbcL family protein
MKITSSAFAPDAQIPEKYTCDGEDVSPPLSFEEAPDGTMSLALVLSDPDAPDMTFYHWVIFNMDPATKVIAEDTIPTQGVMGKNDVGNLEYAGPCPPQGIHRYIFRLYALDAELSLSEGASAIDVEQATEGHVLEMAELIGLYGKA